MKNRKGFTLIELMAVIILLGLIIMIIVPRITDSIENAKKNSAIDSALGYVKSARDYYNVYVLEKDSAIKEGVNWIGDVNPHIELDGELPSSGYFYIKSDKIEYAEFCVNNYHVTYENSSVSATKDEDCLIEEILDRFQETNSRYTSYVEGAASLDIYVYSDPYKSYDGCVAGIYTDEDGNIINVYLGYFKYSTIEAVIKSVYNDAKEEVMNYAPNSFTPNHYYITDLAGYIFLFDNNEYHAENGASVRINYSTNSKSSIINILNQNFGWNFVHKETLEF